MSRDDERKNELDEGAVPATELLPKGNGKKLNATTPLLRSAR